MSSAVPDPLSCATSIAAAASPVRQTVIDKYIDAFTSLDPASLCPLLTLGYKNPRAFAADNDERVAQMVEARQPIYELLIDFHSSSRLSTDAARLARSFLSRDKNDDNIDCDALFDCHRRSIPKQLQVVAVDDTKEDAADEVVYMRDVASGRVFVEMQDSERARFAYVFFSHLAPCFQMAWAVDSKSILVEQVMTEQQLPVGALVSRGGVELMLATVQSLESVFGVSGVDGWNHLPLSIGYRRIETDEARTFHPCDLIRAHIGASKSFDLIRGQYMPVFRFIGRIHFHHPQFEQSGAKPAMSLFSDFVRSKFSALI